MMQTAEPESRFVKLSSTPERNEAVAMVRAGIHSVPQLKNVKDILPVDRYKAIAEERMSTFSSSLYLHPGFGLLT
jgi:hypothetical protein